MSLTLVKNGILYDPKNGIDGQVSDLWLEDSKVVSAPVDSAKRPVRTIDATGLVVMPGGIDMHCHIAGPKVNTARKMIPEDKRAAPDIRRTSFSRSGTTGSVPSTFSTGYLYAGMGYTTAFDAAIPPISARHAHEELQDTPILDKGFYLLMGNNHYLMKQIAKGEIERAKTYVSWLLNAAKGYAVKLVNPGGVEVWKTTGGNIFGLDETVEHFDVTPRSIVRNLASIVGELKLPHPVHIHCNNLGIPGNADSTLETMKALEGSRGHLTHIQFHSYGGDPDRQSTFYSRVLELAEYVNTHRNITVDVGQVMFGETVSMTGDGPLGYFLHKVTGRKWFSGDTEMESGCGIVPITYRNKSMVHSLQWAIGLEWYLLMNDPWRIAMTTDHPNGASFLAYPEIIALLMDRSRRADMLGTLPDRLKQKCQLPELDREYSLYEIAIITRAAPARILGLPNKGHLAIGADADVTIYEPQNDIQTMFELPKYVIQGGKIVVEDSELRSSHIGKLLHTSPSYDEQNIDDIKTWFEEHYTIQFRNYPVDDHFLDRHEIVG